MPTPSILAVHRSSTHSFSKSTQPAIHLLAGLGVEGDAHAGATVRHRYLVRRNPAAPNRSQVHLLEAEFLDALLAESSHSPAPVAINPGELGENLTTRQLPLRSLPLGTRLHLGADAIIALTGLRTPCRLMNHLHPGLMKASFLPGTREPRAGVMAIVLAGGTVRPSDLIRVDLPTTPHTPLRPI